MDFYWALAEGLILTEMAGLGMTVDFGILSDQILKCPVNFPLLSDIMSKHYFHQHIFISSLEVIVKPL